MKPKIGVGIVGMGWMGTDHARGYIQIPHRFPDLKLMPELVACAEKNEERLKSIKDAYGFRKAYIDWRDLIADPEVELVSVTTPNFLHREMVIEAAKAGKHVMCEKPVGNVPTDTYAAARAVKNAGVNSAVGFSYRWAPVVLHAQNMIRRGELGGITHYLGRHVSSVGADPRVLHSWRFDKDTSGLGVTGDMLSHVVNMAQGLVGRVASLTASSKIIVKERPMPSELVKAYFDKGTDQMPKREVTTEDYVSVLARFENGAPGVFEACRVSYGPKTQLCFDLQAQRGSVRWDFHRMNEIQICKDGSGLDGYATVLTGFSHPGHKEFSPGDGIALSFSDLKTIEAARFVEAISEDKPFQPGMEEAVETAEVIETVVKSWESRTWEDVDRSHLC